MDEFREHFYWFEKFSQNMWKNLVAPQIWGQSCLQIWDWICPWSCWSNWGWICPKIRPKIWGFTKFEDEFVFRFGDKLGDSSNLGTNVSQNLGTNSGNPQICGRICPQIWEQIWEIPKFEDKFVPKSVPKKLGNLYEICWVHIREGFKKQNGNSTGLFHYASKKLVFFRNISWTGGPV